MTTATDVKPEIIALRNWFRALQALENICEWMSQDPLGDVSDDDKAEFSNGDGSTRLYGFGGLIRGAIPLMRREAFKHAEKIMQGREYGGQRDWFDAVEQIQAAMDATCGLDEASCENLAGILRVVKEAALKAAARRIDVMLDDDSEPV